MKSLLIVCAIIGVTPSLMAEPSKQSVLSPRDELVKWIKGHQIPELIDVENVISLVPNRYILGDPPIKRSSAEFMEWMEIPKEKLRVDVGVNMGLLRSLEITDEYILVLSMHSVGNTDERYVVRGMVMRKADDQKLSKILWGLMSSNIKQWKEAAPKEGEQDAVE